MRTTSATDLGIRLARPDDRATVAYTLAAAFFDDPVTEWLIPDIARRHQVIDRVFELYAAAYIRHDETYTTSGGQGAALWLPPNRELLTPEEGEAFGAEIEELLGEDARRAFLLEETFAEHHPTEPAYYLQLVATAPDAQGRGIGSALLREVLRQADWERMPAYLEATTERSRALYERHGYVSRGEFTLPENGPTLYPMWREPR